MMFRIFSLKSAFSAILLLSAFLWSLTLLPVQAQVAPAPLSVERRAELEQQLQSVEKQIEEQQKILTAKQNESVSFERDIAILNAKIFQAKLSIKARSLSIEKLTDDIKQKGKIITTLSDKLGREKESLSQIIRKTEELDNYSLVESILADKSLSEFFADIDSFQVVKKSLQVSLGVVSETKDLTEGEKATLEDKKAEQLELLHIQELEKKKIEQQEKEKQNILKISRGIEKEYQKILKEKQLTAAQIKAELFQLQGSSAIPFEQALAYAKEVEGKLGVRAAFILGIIAEESNLGANVGTGNWRIDMHPTRDQLLFEQIVRELGFDPDRMPVSKKAWYGWGGAMGPAQFIPSTWNLYKTKITDITGSNPPNPWHPRDAFFASGVLLKDNGAGKGTRAAERLAALRYLAGWANAQKSAYAFYGNEVMDLADKYQKQIDILEGR